MTNLFLYYLATRLLIIHDWFNGGWSDPANLLELGRLGFVQAQAMLYGTPIPQTLPVVTRSVSWRGGRH